MAILKYKDFQGSADIDIERGVCRGRLLFISDLVTYESDTPKNLQQEFEAAVDDYLDTCESLGKVPQKCFSGLFNVRIPPEDHKAAAILAAQQSKTLNSIVSEAINQFVHSKSPAQVEHNHRLTVTIEGAHSERLWATANNLVLKEMQHAPTYQ